MAKKTDDEKSLVVELSKTYDFEDEKISAIDLSGLENTSVQTMMRVNKRFSAAGNVSVMPEMDLSYALMYASEATDYPIEFFESLRPRDAIKVRTKVINFLFGEE